jgi:acyl-CoA thioesterase
MAAPDPLDVARRCADAMYAADEASRRAGVTVADVSPGRAVARMTVRSDMINGHDICHGGYVFLLADTAFAFACNTYDAVTVAQACDIVFVEPGRLGDELVATAVERLRSGRTGIYDITVRRAADDAVVAEFRGRSRTINGTILGASA